LQAGLKPSEDELRWSEIKEEPCSLARTVSVIGDRWTLLILRDCFLGVRRFDDFQGRLGVTRHVLADRLTKLVEHGVLARSPYLEHPPRFEYRLTQKGRDLHPVIMGLVHWGDMHMAGEDGRPLLHRHKRCGCDFDPVLVCSACAEPVTARGVETRPGPGARLDWS
jgi:DNA-binding HxlR family transcriptional regulator